jgi:hypothetical protein
MSVLAGWSVQQETLDAVEMDVRIIPALRAKLIKRTKPKKKYNWTNPRNGMSTDPIEPPEPALGNAVLALNIRPKAILSEKDHKPLPAPHALERTYLAVNSPQVRLQPGTWVRISAWVRLGDASLSSADGVLVFDSIGGEGMGIRLNDPDIWKEYHVYRKVPASGAVWVTIAQTGLGTVYCDNVKIEPLEMAPANTTISSARP